MKKFLKHIQDHYFSYSSFPTLLIEVNKPLRVFTELSVFLQTCSAHIQMMYISILPVSFGFVGLQRFVEIGPSCLASVAVDLWKLEKPLLSCKVDGKNRKKNVHIVRRMHLSNET